jgi:HSP20 family protein
MIRSLTPWWSRDVRHRDRGGNEDPIEALHRSLSTVLDSFRRDFDLPSLGEWEPLSAPKIDVSETADSLSVAAELPGMDAKNVDVTFQANSLVISGEKTEESEKKDADYHVRERRFGRFHRVVALPEGLDVDKAKAEFGKGVLHVTIPKTDETKRERRRIDIRAR